jgi:hypothetical protein
MKLLEMLRSAHGKRTDRKTGSRVPFEAMSLLIERAAPMPPAYNLCEYVAALPTRPDQKPERRRTPRYSLIVDVRVLPLDEELRPAGAPFTACCRNLSTGGICLYHDSRVEATFLYVEIALFELPPMQAVMRILRQNPAEQFFEIAGEFLCTSGAAQLGVSN